MFILFECGAKTPNPNTVVLVVGGWWVGGCVEKRVGTSEIEVSEIENGRWVFSFIWVWFGI